MPLTITIDLDATPFKQTLQRLHIRPIRGRVGSDGNIAPYNRWVQDEERQARVHRGRWVTLQASMRRREQAIQRLFERRVEMAVRSGSDVNRALRAGMNDATALILRDMRTYPPAIPSSQYRRTGTLRRSWHRRIE